MEQFSPKIASTTRKRPKAGPLPPNLSKPDKTYYLVYSNSNWADEIDFNGWEIFEKSKLDKAIAQVKELVDDSVSIDTFIGTNEEMTIYASEVLKELENAKPISEEEYKTVKKLFGKKYGVSLYNRFINSHGLERYYQEKEEEKEEKVKQKKIDDKFDEIIKLFKD